MFNFEAWFQFLLITTSIVIMVSFITEGMESIATSLKNETAYTIMVFGMVFAYGTVIALIMVVFQNTAIK